MLSSISEATKVEGRTFYLIEYEYSLNATRTCSYTQYTKREKMLFTKKHAAFFGGLLHLQVIVMKSWISNACAKALPRSTVSSLYKFKMNAISFIKSSRIKSIISVIRNIRLAKEVDRFHII